MFYLSEMVTLILISLLVWIPVVFYLISQRGFVLILGWLFVAPVALYALEGVGHAPIVTMGTSNRAQADESGYLAAETNVRARELLNPTRLIFAGCLLMLVMKSALRRRRLERLDTTEKCTFVFALILILSALFQSRRTAFSLRIASDAFIIPFLGYFCLRRLVKTEDHLRRVYQIVTYLGAYLILLGLVERLITPGLYSRVNGPFWSRNELYTVMLVVFFVCWIELLRSGSIINRKGRLLYLLQRFNVFLAPAIVLLGWGRGNLLGLLSGIWMFMFLGRRLLRSSRLMGTIGLLCVLVPTLAIGIYEIIPDQIFEERISRPSTVYARLGAWQIIKEEISKSPAIGIGFNNLRDVLYERRIVYQGVKSETLAHNSFLSILAELGFVGLFAYLAIGFSLVRMGFFMYRRGTSLEEQWRGVAVISIVVSYWVGALFDGTLYRPSVSHAYVYVIMGGIAALHGKRWVSSTIVTARTRNRLGASSVPARTPLT